MFQACLLYTSTIKDGDKVAAIVEVNAETDFVAKNEVFQTFVKEVVEQAADTDAADIDAFKAEKWALDTSMTVDEKLAAMIAKDVYKRQIMGMASGCPLHNLVPEWNDLIDVYKRQQQKLSAAECLELLLQF